MNGYRFTTTVSNTLTDQPVAIHTQSHQIPFQECWSVSIIHKLPNSTPTTSATNLKLHTNSSSNHDTPQDSTFVNPHPVFHPCPSGTYSFESVSSILLLRKDTVFWSKVYIYFHFLSSLYVLATLTCRPNNAIICFR